MTARVWGLTSRARGLVPLLLLVVIWQLIAAPIHTTVLPSPSSILDRIGSDGLSTYLDPLGTTMEEAGLGFAIGVIASVILGALAVRFKVLLPPIGQLATLTYTVPSFVIGAVLVTVVPVTEVRVTISALYVVFTTVVGVVTGMHSADEASLAVVSVAGGGKSRQLWAVRVPAALPAFFSALQIAAPSAILGAVVGEYIGGEGGIGVAMIGAQRSSQVQRTWGLALVVTLASLLAYLVIGFIGRRCTGWAAHAARAGTELRPVPGIGKRALTGTGHAVMGAVIALGAWWLLLSALGVSSFVGRTPTQVASALADDKGGIRHQLLSALGTTLGHTAIGFVVGVAVGVIGACAFSLSPLLERTFLPLVLLAQSVPIIAFLPLALLALGRGTGVVLLVSGLIAFFPTLVNVSSALRSTPRSALDLLSGLGAGSLRKLLLARLPYAAPAVFASVRIAAPAAFTGAILVEWLALGNGLGGLMSTASASYQYDMLWSAVAIAATASILVTGIARAGQKALAHRLHLAAPAL
jgi:sulfonate transport system permease protein